MSEVTQQLMQADRETVKQYLNGKYIHDVLWAYDKAFGTPQELVCELDMLESIVDRYMEADEESRLYFWRNLEAGMPAKPFWKTSPPAVPAEEITEGQTADTTEQEATNKSGHLPWFMRLFSRLFHRNK